MKGAPELAGRGPSARGFSNPLDVRTRRQPDRPIQVQVWFDVGRADVALTAVAGSTAVGPGGLAESSGLVSKLWRVWRQGFLPGLPGLAHGIAHTACGR